MFTSVVGHSEDIDTPDAVAEVIEQCRAELGGRPASAGFLFCYVGHDLELIAKAVSEAFVGIQLIGATTDGELSSKFVHCDTSLVLHILSFDDIQVAVSVARDASQDPAGRVAEAARAALDSLGGEAALCITCPESLTLSGNSVVAGLREALGAKFPIFGGTSGDARRVERTYQFCNGEVLSDSVALMLLSGPIAFSHARVSGWEPMDLAGIVTRSEGNVVYEINEQPAVDFFSRYLGDLHQIAGKYAEYPLIIDGEDGSRQVTVLNVDLEQSSIIFFGEVPQGSHVRLAEADRDMIVGATATSVEAARKDFPEGIEPVTALAFSCAARKGILGTRTMEEGEHMQRLLPNIPFSGFYTYGEIAPAAPGAASHFNNEMFVTLLLGHR